MLSCPNAPRRLLFLAAVTRVDIVCSPHAADAGRVVLVCQPAEPVRELCGRYGGVGFSAVFQRVADAAGCWSRRLAAAAAAAAAASSHDLLYPYHTFHESPSLPQTRPRRSSQQQQQQQQQPAVSEARTAPAAPPCILSHACFAAFF